ncbi:MAG: hypothetical protein ACM3X4_04770 [Ignavibacteriales bacterium]
MRRTLATLATLAVLLAGSPIARANGLPVRWVQEGTGVFAGDEDSQAAVVSEDLLITISRPVPRRGSSVAVRARYAMKLTDGAPAQAVAVAFIHDGLSSSWNVTLDGSPVAVENGGPAKAYGFSLEEETYDPVTGELYDLRGGPSGRGAATLFRVRLEPGKTHDLVVEYVTRSGWDELRYVNPISHFTYYLTPARRWAGFGDLTITLRVPWGYRVATSMGDQLSRRGPGLLVGDFHGLPPGDLHVSIISGLGMLPGIATRGGAHILLLCSLSQYLLALAMEFSRRAMILSAGFAAVVSTWALTRRLWLYPLDLLQTPVLVIILAAIGVSLWRRNRARRRLPGTSS